MTHPFPLYVLSTMSAGLENMRVRRLDVFARLGIGLTLAKIPITVILVSLIAAHFLTAANFLIVFAIILDIADGLVFNASNQASDRFLKESRRVWDGTLDRLLIWSTLCAGVVVLKFPVGLFVLLMLREFAVASVTGYPYLKSRFVHAPNLPSKIGAIFIAVQFICFTSTGFVPAITTTLCVGFSVVGLWRYWVAPKRI